MEGRSAADRRGGRYHVILCVVIGEMTLSTCLLCRLLTQDENQSLQSAAAERTNTNKSEDLTLRCQTSSMPSLVQVQLASNATDSNFTEYVFPDALADPVPGVDALEEINLSENPDAKIKYDGQLTPALLYQIHME